MKKLLPGFAILIAASACDSTRPPPLNPPGNQNPPLTLDAAGVALTAENNLAGHLLTLNTSGSFVGDLSVTKRLNLPISFGSGPSSCVATPGQPTNCTTPTPEETARRTAHDWVTRYLDVPTAVVDPSGASVTFTLQASRYCASSAVKTSSSGGGSSGGGAPPPPAPATSDCSTMLTQIPVRLVVTSHNAGDLDLSLSIGAAHRQPATLKLTPNQIAIDVDLAAVEASLQDLYGAIDPSRRPGLPDHLSGRISFAVIRTGDHDAQIALGIPNDIVISGADYNLSFAARSPALAAHFDGNAQQVSITADVGAIDGSAPLDWLRTMMAIGCSSSTRPASGGTGGTGGTGTGGTGGSSGACSTTALHGTMGIHLGGIKSDLELTRQSDSVALRTVSLGPDTAKLTFNNQTLIGVDLNASHNRSLDLVLTGQTDGIQIAVTPAFELALELGFSLIADQISVASWAQSDHLRITFDGAAQPKLVAVSSADKPAPPPGGNPPPPSPNVMARILEGTLTLGTTALAAPITVPAGQCLIEQSSSGGTGSPAPHPFSQLVAGPCP